MDAEGTKLFRGVIAWIASLLLGTTNNFSYVVVNSAAENVANDFNQGPNFALISAANVMFGSFCRAINATVFARLPFKIRTAICIGMNLLGLFGILVGYWVDQFPVVLVATMFVGSACSFGESFMINNLQLYPPITVSGWSSGTGWAGVVGAFFYIAVYAVTAESNMYVFMTLLGVPVLYGLSYYLILPKPYKEDDDEPADESALGIVGADDASKDSLLENDALKEDVNVQTPNSTGYGHLTTEEQLMEVADDKPILPPSFCKSLWNGYCHFFSLTYQLTAVYFLEYAVTSLGAKYCFPQDEVKTTNNWWIKQSYANLAFCYQIGVLISRSSLQIIKVKYVSIFTILQAVNFALWVANAKLHFFTVWTAYPAMIFVGLMGGASYVNTFYLILNDKNINEKDRALGINITTMHIDAGILGGILFTLAMSRSDWFS